MAYVSDDYSVGTGSAGAPRPLYGWVISIVRAVVSLVDIFAKLFGWRASPQEHLHLHRAARQINTKPANAIRRSVAFRMRALLHRLFTGAGFVEPTAVGSA